MGGAYELISDILKTLECNRILCDIYMFQNVP